MYHLGIEKGGMMITFPISDHKQFEGQLLFVIRGIKTEPINLQYDGDTFTFKFETADRLHLLQKYYLNAFLFYGTLVVAPWLFAPVREEIVDGHYFYYLTLRVVE
jgi:hypothetical protein